MSNNIVTLDYLNKQIKFGSYRRCKDEKEEKHTWDNDFELSTDNKPKQSDTPHLKDTIEAPQVVDVRDI